MNAALSGLDPKNALMVLVILGLVAWGFWLSYRASRAQFAQDVDHVRAFYSEFLEPETGLWMRLNGSPQWWLLSDAGSLYAGPFASRHDAVLHTHGDTFQSQYGFLEVNTPEWLPRAYSWRPGTEGACNAYNSHELFLHYFRHYPEELQFRRDWWAQDGASFR